MDTTQKKFVNYVRVSTAKQGQSGLGLEAQREAAREFVSKQGGTIIGEYVEVETGKLAERPVLKNALAHARRQKATLVVAKLDRLARNVAFTSALMDSGVDFVCCDNPHATRFTIHILAAVAEHEAKMISQRTKEALKAAKARGVLMGSRREGFWEKHREACLAGAMRGCLAAVASKKKAALQAYEDLYDKIIDWRKQGKRPKAIAELLNQEGHKTRRGRAWTDRRVSIVLGLAKQLGKEVQ